VRGHRNCDAVRPQLISTRTSFFATYSNLLKLADAFICAASNAMRDFRRRYPTKLPPKEPLGVEWFNAGSLKWKS
jgi:hypothetical protein